MIQIQNICTIGIGVDVIGIPIYRTTVIFIDNSMKSWRHY